MSDPSGSNESSTAPHDGTVKRSPITINDDDVAEPSLLDGPASKSGIDKNGEEQGNIQIEPSIASDRPLAREEGGSAVTNDGESAPEDVATARRSPLAEDIQRQATEHLARRAAEMGGDSINESRLPESPPAPAAPEKDNARPQDAKDDIEYDEKHTPQNDAPPEDIPEAPRGATEATGAEIQNIMDQFRDGMGGLGEEEIMSPRLEKQQPLLVLPPRTSSLENKDRHSLSPQTTGGSVKSLRFDGSGKDLANPGSALTKTKSDGQESIVSGPAGSIFQPPPPSPDPEPALPFDFHRFLEQLRHRTADPVARFLRSFLNEFGKKQWMVHEQVKIISDFLEFIAKKMSQCDIWRTVSDAEFDNAREGMEKLVMNRLYSQTFSPAIAPAPGSPRKFGKGRSQADIANQQGPGRRGQHQEDVERDEVIAQKIRIYGWVREEHLEIKPMNEKGRKFLLLAQRELLKINSYRAPRDKVICVLNCCKVIFGYLKNSKADQSADAFVPLLIYTVLRARPDHLASNVQYIWRFRHQDKLGGEAGYYMSSLMGAVTFIENLDRTTLTISDEEFERNVEQAVSAIAEQNKAEEYEGKAHVSAPSNPLQHLSEKSALSHPEVTSKHSVEAERSSPRRNVSQRLSEKSGHSSSPSGEIDDYDAVTGLLKTIQKPLSSIGRMFSDDTTSSQPQRSLQPVSTPQPSATPRRLSPDGRVSQERPTSERHLTAADAAARQASAEAAEAQRVRAREHKVVVETLQSMFPNLDREVIEDVTRAQEGHVGRAVDACLAMSGGE